MWVERKNWDLDTFLGKRMWLIYKALACAYVSLPDNGTVPLLAGFLLHWKFLLKNRSMWLTLYIFILSVIHKWQEFNCNWLSGYFFSMKPFRHSYFYFRFCLSRWGHCGSQYYFKFLVMRITVMQEEEVLVSEHMYRFFNVIKILKNEL